MTIITTLVLWIAGHGPTCGALALTFIVGSVFGMWIEFSNRDKEKSTDHFAE